MAYPDLPIWPFAPNWSGTVNETLIWLTDIMSSKTGSEQRRSLRRYPKQTMDYVTLLSRKERRRHDNLISTIGAHDWMLPLWFDTHYPTGEYPAGSNFIGCDTAQFGDFKVGGWLLLVSKDSQKHRVLQIGSIDKNGIGLLDILPSVLETHTQIVPLKKARFTEEPQMRRQTDETVTGNLSFTVMESNIRDFNFATDEDGPLIQKYLVARKYGQFGDGSPFNPASGTTDGQVIMILACFRAADALKNSLDSYSIEAADYYTGLAFSLLDAFVGDGDGQGPIMRQPLPASPSTVTVPHWLFAAKGDVPDIANVGTGYEMVPTGAAILAAGFASADPQTFRDIETILTLAIARDLRSGAASKWANLRSAFRRTNFLGRAISDGRDIIAPLPGYAIIPPLGEPQGLYSYSDHTRASANTLVGTGPNQGANFFGRLGNGDIVASLPESVDFTSVEDPNNPGTFIITAVPRVAVLTFGRNFYDRWRAANAYQTADQYLFLQIGLNRAISATGERVSVNLLSGGLSWSANITNEDIVIANGVKTVLIPRDRFTNASGAIPAGSVITSFSVSVFAQAAYQLTLRSMRMLAGASAAAVAADVNKALQGDVIAYSPGVAPYRISADVNRQRYIGFNGIPALGAQRPDQWAEAAEAADSHFAGLTPSKLPVVREGSQAITYPISATVTDSVGSIAKPPSALLAEQNLLFMQSSQNQFVIDSGKLGPFAHSFVTNIEDRRFIANAEPHRWVYDSYLPIQSIFWQARAVESICRLHALTGYEGQVIVHNGQRLLYKGKQITYGSVKNQDSLFNFDTSRPWSKVRQLAEDIAINFLSWYLTDWPGKNFVVYNGAALTFGGKLVSYTDRSITEGDLPVSDTVVNPAQRLPYYTEQSPHIAAVILRCCVWLKASKGATFKRFDPLMVLCWNYIELFWRTEGEMQYTWSVAPNSHELYSLHHGEILLTISKMIDKADLLPAEIDKTLLEPRLALARLSFENFLVGDNTAETVPAFGKNYLGYSVMIDNTNEKADMQLDTSRLTESLDNDIAFPVRGEYDGRSFNRVQRPWWIKGRENDYRFRAILYAMRGRAVPVWVPSLMQDFSVTAPIEIGTNSITVENCGYSLSGGPRDGRRHVSIELFSGVTLYREIVSAYEQGLFEVIVLGQAISQRVLPEEIHRISFIELMRFDQDSVEIAHVTDVSGLSTASTYLVSVKENRKTQSSVS